MSKKANLETTQETIVAIVLKEVRVAKGLSVKEAAERAALGERRYRRIEDCDGMKLTEFFAIVTAIGCVASRVQCHSEALAMRLSANGWRIMGESKNNHLRMLARNFTFKLQDSDPSMAFSAGTGGFFKYVLENEKNH